MPLLSVDEAASQLGINSKSVRRLIWSRQLPAVRIGRRTLIDEKDLKAFVKARKVAVPA